MAWRMVVQPNGKYARFSEVVDGFTDYGLTRDEAYELCRVHMGVEEAKGKMRRADNSPDRWSESLATIEAIHGRDARDAAEREITAPSPTKAPTEPA